MRAWFTDMQPRVRMRQLNKVDDDKLYCDGCMLSPHPDAQTRCRRCSRLVQESALKMGRLDWVCLLCSFRKSISRPLSITGVKRAMGMDAVSECLTVL